MKVTTKTDPFTGLEIEVIELDNKSLIISSPFYKTFNLEYDENLRSYILPAIHLKHRKTISLNEASKLLNVSTMQVSRFCSDGSLKSAKINNELIIDYESALELKRKRVKNVRNNKSVVTINSD